MCIVETYAKKEQKALMIQITGNDAQIVGHGFSLLGIKCTTNARRRDKAFYMTQTGKNLFSPCSWDSCLHIYSASLQTTGLKAL